MKLSTPMQGRLIEIADTIASGSRAVGRARRYEIAPDDCVDGDGEVWGEHDYPPEGEGNECRRCGAEAES